MAASTISHAHPLWTETVLVAQAPNHRDESDAHEPSAPAPSTTASQTSVAENADQWVSQALFDCYNR